MSAIIGVDVGSTTMSGGLVTAEGEILSAVQMPTHRDGRGSALDTLVEVVDGLLTEARARDIALLGVGVGLPGLVDGSEGIMRSSSNHVPEFHDVSLADRLAAQTRLPAFVDNDVNALGARGVGLRARARRRLTRSCSRSGPESAVASS